MRTLRFSAYGEVLVSDEDFVRLGLSGRMQQSTIAARIQSHIGEAPLLDGRENSVRVSLVVEDSKPKPAQLIEA